MSDDRFFNYLSSRVSSRESASLALVGLSSSSSLVFLGLVFEKLTTASYWEFFFIGILFPSLGFAYNEITNRGIHKDDQHIINELIKEEDKEKWNTEKKDKIVNRKYRVLRLFLMRFGLLSPILGWLLTLPIQLRLDLDHRIECDIFFVILVPLVSYIIARTNQIKY